MRVALASLLLIACDAQVDNGYSGEPLVRLQGTAIGFRPDEVAEAAAVRWNPQRGTDLTAGPVRPLPMETNPPSGLAILVLDEPPGDALFSFAGEPARIAEGALFLVHDGDFVGDAIGTRLVYVAGAVEPGSLTAAYLGGVPVPGFHMCDVRATAELGDAQAYLTMACGGGDACRSPRLYQLVPTARDLATRVQFFRRGP